VTKSNDSAAPKPCLELLHIDCRCPIWRERVSEEARRRAVPLRAPDVELTPSGNVKKTRAAELVNKDGTGDKRAANGGHPNSKKRKSPWLARAEAERQAQTSASILEQAFKNPDELIKLQRVLQASLCVDDFSEFCRQAWTVVEPSTPLQWNWHHQLICCVLQSLFEHWLIGNSDPTYIPPVVNTVLNVCPGSLKSRLVNVFFPAWVWLRAPSAKFICLSVNEDATMRDARSSRLLITSEWYTQTFAPKWSLQTDQAAISNYGNTMGGERLSKPSGSEIVGLRSDFLLYDDPNAADETIEERVKVNHIWTASLYTRVNHRRSMRIGIQQRVGEGDWTDHVCEKQGLWGADNLLGWLKIVLPAEFDPARKFIMPECLANKLRGKLPVSHIITEDPRTDQDQPVHPERANADDLKAERKRWAGTGHYDAQYQQEPGAKEGTVIKKPYFKFFTLERGVRPEVDDRQGKRPRPAGMEALVCGDSYQINQRRHSPGNWDFDWVALSIDCALKKTERGSQWGMVMMAGQRGRRFVLDDRTKRGDILEILKVMADMVTLWKPNVILVEDKAAGDEMMRRIQSAIAEGDKTFAGCIIEPIKVPNHLGKDARVDLALPTFANGLVHLLDGADWLDSFLSELTKFPRARHDDRVDAVTQCIMHYMDSEPGGMQQLPDW